jgi:hypothetical protein
MMLMLHTDAVNTERGDLSGLPVPEASPTWQPVSHDVFDNLVRTSLSKAGVEVHASSYGLSKPTSWGFRHRMFAVLQTQDVILNGQVGLTIGLRNSTDQSLAAGLVFGSRVFVCDNLAFSGEYVIRRKHTSRIMDDLPGLIDRGVGKYFEQVDRQQVLFEALQNRSLSDREAYHAMVLAASRGIVSYSRVKDVRKEWHTPSHEVFSPRNAWSLYNAFTEVAKKYVPITAADRTLRLTGFFRGMMN